MAFITLHLALLIMTRSLILLLGNKYEARIYPPEKKVIMNREGVVWETEVSWPEKVEHMVCHGSQLCHGPARSFSGNHVYTFCFCFCTWKMERTRKKLAWIGRALLIFLFQLREIFEMSFGVKWVLFP